jgi:hypothetical protein
MSEGQDRLEGELALLGERLDKIEGSHRAAVDRHRDEQAALSVAEAARRATFRRIAWIAGGALAIAIGALAAALLR